MIPKARALYLSLLRDLFAAACLPISTVMQKHENGTYTADPVETARKAYAIANAMMGVREGRMGR